MTCGTHNCKCEGATLSGVSNLIEENKKLRIELMHFKNYFKRCNQERRELKNTIKELVEGVEYE